MQQNGSLEDCLAPELISIKPWTVMLLAEVSHAQKDE